MGRAIAAANVRLKRAYDPPARADGMRLLIDRLWPRGLSKRAAALDEWLRDLAPSNELRTWFGHDPAKWPAFQRRYTRELRQHAKEMQRLRALASAGPITLVYGARDREHNDAVVLRKVLLGRSLAG
ncbi:MAG: DUF488 family protein [Gammaproteobacteria bacterium]|nr:DUF488 family protein [Gammaproteobacteria bacterium]